jgi:predicted sugar kinase
MPSPGSGGTQTSLAFGRQIQRVHQHRQYRHQGAVLMRKIRVSGIEMQREAMEFDVLIVGRGPAFLFDRVKKLASRASTTIEALQLRPPSS